MAYEDLSFKAGEVLTATKMNKMQSNMNALKDGTEIDSGAIKAKHINDDAYLTDDEIEELVDEVRASDSETNPVAYRL